LNRLDTIDNTLIKFISRQNILSIYSYNCQGLRSHYQDIIADPVASKCNILILSETNIDCNSRYDIPKFNCIVKFKRDNVRSGGVAIFSHRDNITHVITSHIDLQVKNSIQEDATKSNIGDLCTAQCITENGMQIIIVVVYISPNNTVNEIIRFLRFNLLPYSVIGTSALQDNYNNLPMIVSGDFNINFDKETSPSQPLIEFFQDMLHLNIVNHRNQSTTIGGTTIDAVFSRFLDKIDSKNFISYFSYHKPIITIVESNKRDSLQ